MEFIQYIEINPRMMIGKPVISSTRITIGQIPVEPAADVSIDEIIHAHPNLSK